MGWHSRMRLRVGLGPHGGVQSPQGLQSDQFPGTGDTGQCHPIGLGGMGYLWRGEGFPRGAAVGHCGLSMDTYGVPGGPYRATMGYYRVVSGSYRAL